MCNPGFWNEGSLIPLDSLTLHTFATKDVSSCFRALVYKNTPLCMLLGKRTDGTEILWRDSVQSLSRVRLCDPMNRSTPGLPVHHQLPESTQTLVRRVDDAIQPSHLLSSPSPALNLSQHQGLFQWVSSLHQVAEVLELQHQSFQWYSGLISFRTDGFDFLAVQGISI